MLLLTNHGKGQHFFLISRDPFWLILSLFFLTTLSGFLHTYLPSKGLAVKKQNIRRKFAVINSYIYRRILLG
jgi:hypothetical protein